MKDGYAPFCKHIFIPNFTEGRVYYTEINEKTKNLIESDYVARNEKELAVLKRYIPRENFQTEKAKFMDVILYSKEQIDKEENNKNVNLGKYFSFKI